METCFILTCCLCAKLNCAAKSPLYKWPSLYLQTVSARSAEESKEDPRCASDNVGFMCVHSLNFLCLHCVMFFCCTHQWILLLECKLSGLIRWRLSHFEAPAVCRSTCNVQKHLPCATTVRRLKCFTAADNEHPPKPFALWNSVQRNTCMIMCIRPPSAWAWSRLWMPHKPCQATGRASS